MFGVLHLVIEPATWVRRTDASSVFGSILYSIPGADHPADQGQK
jgi:hypothetical protein